MVFCEGKAYSVVLIEAFVEEKAAAFVCHTFNVLLVGKFATKKRTSKIYERYLGKVVYCASMFRKRNPIAASANGFRTVAQDLSLAVISYRGRRCVLIFANGLG